MIQLVPVSNTTYSFVATGDATYFGVGFNRTSGTMTAVVSNFSLKEVGSVLVTSNSNVGIGTTSPANTVKLDVVGDIRTSTGILFGTDTAAANLLDDYEEGTFTPTVTSVGGTGIVYTPVGDTGTYTKIGRLVTFSVNLYGTYTGTFTYVRIALPFTVGSVNDAIRGYNNATAALIGGRTDASSARFLTFNFQASGETGIYTGSYNV